MRARHVLVCAALVLSSQISVYAAIFSNGAPNPNDLDLLMWLKADNLSSLIPQTLPLANGNSIIQWNDSSNKGHHMYGGIAGVSYPTFITGALGGLPAVHFDGTPKNLSNGNGTNAVVLNQEHTIIVVGHSQKTVAESGWNDAFLSYVSYVNGGLHQGTDTELVVYQNGSTKVFRIRYPGVDTVGSTANSELLNPTIYTQVRANTTHARAYVNKAVPHWLHETSPTTDFPTSGQIFRIGQCTYAGQYLKGDLYEILIYNRALSVLELQEVYDYLKGKWFGNPNPPAQVVFQSDFSGTGSGTGGANDVVTFGGTGALFTDTGANLTSNIFTAFSPFPSGAGGYLNLNDTNSTAGTANTGSGVRFTPATSNNSPDAWYRNRGSSNFDLLNGGLDFLVCCDTASSSWVADTFYPLDIDGGAGGLRQILKSTAANTLRFQLLAKNGANTAVQTLTADVTVSMAANTVYHIGLTAQTDASGVVTIKLFVQPGNAPLDTSAIPAASASSSGALDAAGTNAVNHAFSSTPTFRFGKMNNPTGDVTYQLERFRVFGGVPAVFDSFELFPDLTAVTKPSPEPTYPAGFDLFTPPVSGSAPAADTPTFAEWTRTGTADDALVATGDKLTTFTSTNDGKDTRFVTYGQTPQGLLTKDASIYRLDGNKLAFGLDASLPKWSMYFLWPQNFNGYGRPAAINQTEAWWLGPSTATRGDTISVYGRNLAHDGGTSTAWIYIKPITGGGAAQWVTPTAVNPYKVDFVVPPPTSFSNGTYEVWTHNGHGRGYGWSGPLTLTVDSGNTWTGATYNVTTYGANGADGNDDTTAVIAAMNAANAAATLTNRTTVNFPVGTYYIHQSLVPVSNVRLLGAGKTNTHIEGTGSFNGSMISFPTNTSNLEIADLHLNFGTAVPTNGNDVFILQGIGTNLRIKNVSFTAVGHIQHWLASVGGDRLVMQDCDLAGKIFAFNSATQVFVDRCDFRGRGDVDIMYTTGGCRDVSITRCTARDYDNSNPAGTGWSNGRFCYAGNGARSARNFYWGENTTTDLGTRPGVSGNQAEQISFDVGGGRFLGNAASATSTTVTFSSLTGVVVNNELQAVIVGGKGQGQWRTVAKIIASDLTSNALRVTTPWNVIPDSTSVVAVGAYNERAIVYRNHLDGKVAAVTQTEPNASAGIQPYAGTTNMVADGNTITECRVGLYLVGVGNSVDVPFTSPSCFSLFTNNLIQTTRYPIYLDGGGDNTFPAGSYLFGQVLRGNTIAKGLDWASQIKSAGGNYGVDMAVYDRTVATDIPVGINHIPSGLNYLGNFIFSSNYLDRGASTFSGSKGISFSSTAKNGLFGNSWLNFQTNYAGTLPGAIVEVPYRVLNVTGKVGGSSQTTAFSVQNAGTANLTWDKALVDSWLSVTTSGPYAGVAADGGKSTVTVTCNPAGLTANTYKGDINAQVSGVTKKVATVIFTVNP